METFTSTLTKSHNIQQNDNYEHVQEILAKFQQENTKIKI